MGQGGGLSERVSFRQMARIVTVEHDRVFVSFPPLQGWPAVYMNKRITYAWDCRQGVLLLQIGEDPSSGRQG